MEKDIKKITRLTAMLTQLQTKKLLTATELAKKFSVSVRTVYRDIRILEEAGVPIFTEDGKGYSLLGEYRLPPVMFTEGEANALITAGQLVLTNKDSSFIKEHTEAIHKIKSILRNTTKEKANLLSERIVFRLNPDQERTSHYLVQLQMALTNFNLVTIDYNSVEPPQIVQRTVEPFALYNTQENWILIAFCRLRNDYRAFRLDRIKKFTILNETFEPHPLSLQEYFEICREKAEQAARIKKNNP